MAESFRHLFKSYGGKSGTFQLGKGLVEEEEEEDEEKTDVKPVEVVEVDVPRVDGRKKWKFEEDILSSSRKRARMDVQEEEKTERMTTISRSKSQDREEINLDLVQLASQFVRKGTEEEIEEEWMTKKREIWVELKAKHRDALRDRKHGNTNVTSN